MYLKGSCVIIFCFVFKTALGRDSEYADKNQEKKDGAVSIFISMFERHDSSDSETKEQSKEEVDSPEATTTSSREELSVIDLLISSAGNMIESYLRLHEVPDFATEFLNAHNAYRKKHGVPPLVFNNNISEYATEWAKTLAVKGDMKHRPQNIYGENIFYVESSDPNFILSGAEPVDSWYSEVENYVFGREPAARGTGHFSQVIWKNSKEVGVGVAKSQDGKVFVVANYLPPGNVLGRHFENVPAPIIK